MAKSAEKLWVLVETGDGVLTRLHQAKESLTRNKPVFLLDTAYKGLLTAMVKKFPEPAPRLEGVPGYDLLASNSSKLIDQLQLFYETFLDVMRWKDLAFGCLCEVASSTCALSVMANPFLTYRFLEVVSLFIRIHVFLSSIADRKAVLAMYAKCYEMVNRGDTAPDVSKLSMYICEYESPFKRVLAEFKPITGRIAQALVGLKPTLEKVLNLQLLRKDGALSVTLNPHHLAVPATDQFDFDAVLSARFHDWVLFGLLFTPEDYGTQKDLMPLCRTVLQHSFVAQIFRDEFFYIHKEYENLFSTYKSSEKDLTKMLRKERKTIAECLNHSAGQGARHHRQMRAYVRQELESLISIIEEFPGLIGPKFQTIMHALAIARDEIFWFFRHRGSPMPQGTTKKHYWEDEYRDPHLILLFDRMMKMKKLVRDHKRVIQTYYLQFLQGQDSKRVKELVASNFGSMSPGKVEMDDLQAIMKELESIDVRGFMQGTVDYDFRMLRLNWYRVEASMSLQTAPVSIVAARDLSLKFHTIIWHSRNVDEIDKMLEEYTSLSGLWFHKLALFLEFDAALASCRHPSALGAVFHVLNELPLAANMFNPQDRPLIGEECVQYAEKFIKGIADKIGTGLFMCSESYVNFDRQVEPQAAAFSQMVASGMKVTGDPPVTPGSESLYKNKLALIPVRMSLKFVWALCSILQHYETIVIYDTRFCPREYLRDKINILLKMFSRKIAEVETNKEMVLQKPTTLEREFRSFRNLLMGLEAFIDLNIADLLREFWLEEVWNDCLQHQVTPEAAYAWVGADPLKLSDSFVGKIVSWYAGTFAQKILQPASIGSVIYSETGLSFFSKAGFPFQAQEYFNLPELVAAARLVGPFGFRLLDRELLRMLAPLLTQIGTHVQACSALYEEFEKNATNMSALEATVKKIRDIDQFSSVCIFAGTILAFRRLLRRALFISAREVVPAAVAVADLSHRQYSRNTLLSPALLPTDSIGDYCGIDPTIVDQPLAHLIKKHVSIDAATINLLPAAFAALFFSRSVQDSLYLKQHEAHTNNTSTLPWLFSQLLFSFKSVSSTAPQVESDILALKRRYVEICSHIIINLARTSPNTGKFTSLASVVAQLDMFIEVSPFMTREFLEPLLPYSLIRSMYKELYAMPTPKGW